MNRTLQKRSWEQKRGSCSKLVSSLLCSKILEMPQTHCQVFSSTFFPGMRTESEQDWLHWASLKAEPRSSAMLWVCKQLQLPYRHWMAQRGANYRCCSLLGRGKGRVLIPGKVDTSSGLKRELSSNILGLYTFLPQGQDFDKCYPIRIIPPCSKLSVLVCTFPFGLKVKWIIRKRHLHHNAKQEDRL